MKFEELEKGLEVVYIPNHLRYLLKPGVEIKNMLHFPGVEVGIVSSYNEQYVFVDYDNAGWGKATHLKDLEILI